MSVLVVGDLMVAVSGRVDRLPHPGENLVLREPVIYATGVAANIALNLRGLDAEAHVAGAVGRDALGDLVLGELRSAGVGVELVERSEEPTATFVFMIEPNGERTMVGARG
ncbi:MAG TPA: carbohydrate kinase family protein, partial [Actinomycetota bacterium]|nr:carbohydrate kinase family protein [Actinomycetota bacterium]